MELSKCNEGISEAKNKRSDSVCRLCMSKNANNPIFPDTSELKNDKGPPLVCKIMSSVNIQVKKDDGLPIHVCDDCVNKVESTYEFLRLCEMSDSFLRQYLDFGLRISWFFRYSELLRVMGQEEELLQMINQEEDDEDQS